MTSLSLSRVLQPRRTSLEQQREQFLKFQNQSINKAVNAIEVPVKEKHVRSTIIGTFYEKGAGTFWVVAQRLPIEENRIVAWKFCHVLHKVLREGHANCLQQSQRHKGMLTNLGKLWMHLKDGYGRLIRLYTTLLVTKINFHDRNPNIPGNLQLTSEELESIGGNDINNYFQLSVEMFDYMDDVLALQGAIFDVSDTPLYSSMTNSGQCRLAPLIPCIQDSNQLYDFSVKLLFKLHTMLPADTLSGHRERFNNQFKLLKKFYRVTSNLQYFKNLISIPSLPENPPNFLIQSELTSYRPPVVILPPEEQMDTEQELIANLIDTSDTSSQIASPDTPDSTEFNGTQRSSTTELLIEKSNLIDNLQTEISRLRNERDNLSSEIRATAESMNDQMSYLENQLALAKLELEKEREQSESLKIQLSEMTPPKTDSIDERTKASEEKYQKLKSVYLQTREEHIKLLRQNAETDKQIGALKKSILEHESKNEALQSTISELSNEISKISEVHVKNSNDIQSEIETLQQELYMQSINYREEVENLNKNFEKLKEENEALKSEFSNLQRKYEEERERSNTAVTQLSVQDGASKKEISALQLQYEDKLNDLEIKVSKYEKEYEFIDGKLKATVERNEEEKEGLRGEIVNLKNTIESKENEHRENVEKLNITLNEIKKSYDDVQTEIGTLSNEKTNLANRIKWCENEKLNLECELQDLLQNKESLEDSVSRLQTKCDELNADISKEKESVSILMWSLMRCGVRSAFEIMKNTTEELENPAISSLQCGPDYLRALLSSAEESLASLEPPLQNLEESKIPSENVASAIVKTAHLISQVVIHGVATSNTSKDIVFGERMAQECRNLANATLACISHVELFNNSEKLNSLNGSSLTSKEHIASIKDLMQSISKLGGGVGGQEVNDASDSVENELADMDKAIEEAAALIAQMLQKSRAADSGIKLEVNEKILDACTNLMAAVRELVKKSRALQGEIVSLGRGTNTAKEFYKRNHQWTEGLISAAKSVALGGNLLLTSADKLVTGGGKLEHVMVASQEIAASTAQLVVASRVRATPGSSRLEALSVASRAVSSATGAVIATAKSCSQLIEDSEELDMSNLSLQAGRRLEMESRVKVIELEQALNVERLKLAALRRRNYQLGEVEEGKL